MVRHAVIALVLFLSTLSMIRAAEAPVPATPAQQVIDIVHGELVDGIGHASVVQTTQYVVECLVVADGTRRAVEVAQLDDMALDCFAVESILEHVEVSDDQRSPPFRSELTE